jgi:hypothetical protein
MFFMTLWIIPARPRSNAFCRTKDRPKSAAHDKKHGRLILKENLHGFGIHT